VSAAYALTMAKPTGVDVTSSRLAEIRDQMKLLADYL
jgi:hypothetical protein